MCHVLYAADLVHRASGVRFQVERVVPFGVLAVNYAGGGVIVQTANLGAASSAFRVERSAATGKA